MEVDGLKLTLLPIGELRSSKRGRRDGVKCATRGGDGWAGKKAMPVWAGQRVLSRPRAVRAVRLRIDRCQCGRRRPLDKREQIGPKLDLGQRGK